MKFIATAICSFFIAAAVHAQTLNWGNEIYGEVVDSNGNTLDNSFVFELGAFVSGFDPDVEPMQDWYSNWRVFDATTYDTNDDRFASQVVIQGNLSNPSLNETYTTSAHPSASSMNFSGLDAYIWIRKGNDPVPGSEWLLVRANEWTFPVKGTGCCSLPLMEWSTASDLGATVPLWGRQHNIEGPGEGVFDSGSYGPLSPTLQTFTFIPEPGAYLMTAMTASMLLLRRRRSAQTSLA